MTGYPKPKITWSKSPGHLPVKRVNNMNGKLTMTNVKRSDSGLYSCRASNKLGLHVAMVMVVTHLIEFIKRPPSQVNSLAGQTIKIDCSVKGVPQPVVTWRREGGQMPVASVQTRDGSLIMKNVAVKDSGTYVCSAKTHTSLKGVEATTRLVVKAKGKGECSFRHPCFKFKLNCS